jgi:hypothetical protein
VEEEEKEVEEEEEEILMLNTNIQKVPYHMVTTRVHTYHTTAVILKNTANKRNGGNRDHNPT